MPWKNKCQYRGMSTLDLILHRPTNYVFLQLYHGRSGGMPLWPLEFIPVAKEIPVWYTSPYNPT